MKPTLLIFVLVFFIKAAYGQQAAYTLPLPEKWGVEKIPFPIQFAPLIPLKGNEEIRFTPGWGDSKSDEYWSYSFIWFVDGAPHIDNETLQLYFTQYFNGLFKTNQKPNAPATPADFTKVSFTKTAASANDQETYNGTINTLNFLTGLPLTLNVKAHVRNFGTIGKSALLFELSPQDRTHSVWTKLDGIVAGFEVK
jgi:hypothetical protein